MANNEPKQVLVWRSDVRNTQGQKVRTGKIAAQMAHASLKALLDAGNITKDYSDNDGSLISVGFYIRLFEKMFRKNSQPEIHHQAAIDWIEGRFTKVALQADNEDEITEIYRKAKEAGLLCSLIVDSGLTEFGGVPTITCCAVGPAYPDQFIGITDHLKTL